MLRTTTCLKNTQKLLYHILIVQHQLGYIYPYLAKTACMLLAVVVVATEAPPPELDSSLLEDVVVTTRYDSPDPALLAPEERYWMLFDSMSPTTPGSSSLSIAAADRLRLSMKDKGSIRSNHEQNQQRSSSDVPRIVGSVRLRLGGDMTLMELFTCAQSCQEVFRDVKRAKDPPNSNCLLFYFCCFGIWSRDQCVIQWGKQNSKPEVDSVISVHPQLMMSTKCQNINTHFIVSE